MAYLACLFEDGVKAYHADGGPIGEVRYIIGKLLGTAHCALCDITHSPFRRKAASISTARSTAAARSRLG